MHAEAAGQDHAVTLLLEVTQKQIGQLYREWYAIVDVIEVRSGASLHEHDEPELGATSSGFGEHVGSIRARGVGVEFRCCLRRVKHDALLGSVMQLGTLRSVL